MTRESAVKLTNEALKANRLKWTASCDEKDDGIFVALVERHNGAQVPWSLCECGCLCACLNPHYVTTADAASISLIVTHLIKDIEARQQ